MPIEVDDFPCVDPECERMADGMCPVCGLNFCFNHLATEQHDCTREQLINRLIEELEHDCGKEHHERSSHA
jgi:hypothetical protein